MRLRDLTKDVSNMTDEELQAHVRQIRSNKYVVKPAVQKRVADVEKKERNTATRKTRDLFEGMTIEEKAELLKLLEGDAGEQA